jgi:hypothetical protein
MNNLSLYPEYTKQTRCNNNLNNNNIRQDYTQDYLRPISSNIPRPMVSNYDNYMFDNNAGEIYNRDLQKNQYDIERGSVCTRNNVINNRKPVQQDFQNNYFTMNFDNLNNDNNDEINKFLIRNPVNARRDDIEKVRNNDRQDFLKTQGGPITNFNDFRTSCSRKNKEEINTSNYIPMPRTMAIPKENI